MAVNGRTGGVSTRCRKPGPPRADDGGSLSRIGSAVLRILRRKRPLRDKFAHALHSSVHEREMICDRGSAVRGSMTSPDVRATSRAYVAGLERHKMEEWRTNAASGPRLGASSMEIFVHQGARKRMRTHPWMKDGAQVLSNFILKRRCRLFLNRARHRPHPDLLLRRVRRSIIREILANAPAVGSKSIDKWCVGRQRQHHIQRIVAERASIEAGHLKCGGCSKLVRQCVGTNRAAISFPYSPGSAAEPA